MYFFYNLVEKIREELSVGNRGKHDDHFLSDYYSCNLTIDDLPIKKVEDQAVPISEQVSFVIAWIKKLVCDAEKDKESLIYPPG